MFRRAKIVPERKKYEKFLRSFWRLEPSPGALTSFLGVKE
jgi:hypothetical protein